MHTDAGIAGLDDLFDAYAAETGSRVRRDDDARADLVLYGNLAELWAAAEDDELRPAGSATLADNVAAPLRDPESRWVALAYGAIVVVHNVARVSADELESIDDYAALGESAWQGRLCLGSSALSSNVALIAHLIRRHGERDAELIVRRWRANLAQPEFADADSLLAAVASGACDVALADSRAFAARRSSTRDPRLAAHWPQTAAIDVSGAGVSRHAERADQALALLEWLTQPAPNALHASRTFALPVNAASPRSLAVADWPAPDPGPQEPLADIGFLLEDAVLLAERARYR